MESLNRMKKITPVIVLHFLDDIISHKQKIISHVQRMIILLSPKILQTHKSKKYAQEERDIFQQKINRCIK